MLRVIVTVSADMAAVSDFLGYAPAVMVMPMLRHVRLLCSLRYPGWVYPSLAIYTQMGYMASMQQETKTSCLKRLNRIEGQVRGLIGMVDDDRYCIDVVTQISAVRAALKRVEEEVLKDHVSHCVEHAITAGDPDEQRQKINELMLVLGKM